MLQGGLRWELGQPRQEAISNVMDESMDDSMVVQPASKGVGRGVVAEVATGKAQRALSASPFSHDLADTTSFDFGKSTNSLQASPQELPDFHLKVRRG